MSSQTTLGPSTPPSQICNHLQTPKDRTTGIWWFKMRWLRQVTVRISKSVIQYNIPNFFRQYSAGIPCWGGENRKEGDQIAGEGCHYTQVDCTCLRRTYDFPPCTTSIFHDKTVTKRVVMLLANFLAGRKLGALVFLGPILIWYVIRPQQCPKQIISRYWRTKFRFSGSIMYLSGTHFRHQWVAKHHDLELEALS